MSFNQQLFTQQYTRTLSEIYPDLASFQDDYENIGLPQRLKSAAFLGTIYILLMGEYASSSIMSLSEDQFRIKLFTIIMAHGPQYERELEIQSTLLAMTDDELQVSSKQIHNVSLNPSTEPDPDTSEFLDTINQQNVTKHIRSPLTAYSYLGDLLDADLTKRFIQKFDKLFVRVLRTNNPLYYTTEDEE